jgi:uncharacterized protein (DUF433 family)
VRNLQVIGVHKCFDCIQRKPEVFATIKHMAQAITRNLEVMHGIPVFRGTRVPVQTMFDYLEGGESLEEFLEGFPTVSRELALQALEEAKQLLLARV